MSFIHYDKQNNGKLKDVHILIHETCEYCYLKWLKGLYKYDKFCCCCCSVAQSCLTLCDPMDYSTPGFPVLPFPRACSISCPQSRWCHPTISSYVILFSSCLQTFPALGSFPKNQLFASGGQTIGISASASVLPINIHIQGWFPLGLTGLISLQSQRLSIVFFNTTFWKHQFFSFQPSLWSDSHMCMTTGKTIALTRLTFVSKVITLFFNMLSRVVIDFLPRKHLLISWLQSLSAVILVPKKIKSFTVLLFPHLFAMTFWDGMPWSSFFECWVLRKQLFHSFLSPSSRGSLAPLTFLPLEWYHLHIQGYW